MFDPDDNRLDLTAKGVQIVIQGYKTSSDPVLSDEVLEAAQSLTVLNAGAVRPSSPTP